MKKILLFIYICFLFTPNLYASSCCSSGSDAINIIFNEEKNQFNFSYSNNLENSYISFKNVEKKFKYYEKVQEKLNLNFIRALNSFHQLGLALTMQENFYRSSNKNDKHTGLSNLAINYNYEYLPEFFYHPIKPRGFISFKYIKGSDKSIYDSEKAGQIDVFGPIQDQITLTNTFYKANLFKNDININLSKSYFFEESKSINKNQYKFRPYLKDDIGISIGRIIFEENSLRLFAGVNYNYTHPKIINIDGKEEISSSITNYSNNFGLSFQYKEYANYSIAYSTNQYFKSRIRNNNLFQAINISCLINW